MFHQKEDRVLVVYEKKSLSDSHQSRAVPVCAALSAARGFLSDVLSPAAPAGHEPPLAAAPPDAGPPALRPAERSAEKHNHSAHVTTATRRKLEGTTSMLKTQEVDHHKLNFEFPFLKSVRHF